VPEIIGATVPTSGETYSVPPQPSGGRPTASAPASGRALQLFKTWFWRPPRPHGETIVDRRVSPLELLYDLVYSAVIAQAGIRFAGCSWSSCRALADASVLAAAFRPLWAAMAAGAVVSLVIGWAWPAPWLLALLLVAVLGPVWAVAVRGFVLAGAWGGDGLAGW